LRRENAAAWSLRRHCEERSDAAIQSHTHDSGLLRRYAPRNGGGVGWLKIESESPLSDRHPEVPSRSGGLEGRRPGCSSVAYILRGSLRSRLRMTVCERRPPIVEPIAGSVRPRYTRVDRSRSTAKSNCLAIADRSIYVARADVRW